MRIEGIVVNVGGMKIQRPVTMITEYESGWTHSSVDETDMDDRLA